MHRFDQTADDLKRDDANLRRLRTIGNSFRSGNAHTLTLGERLLHIVARLRLDAKHRATRRQRMG